MREKIEPEKYSIYFSSNDAGRTYHWTITKSKIKGLAVLSFVLSLLFLCTLLDYITLNLQSPEYDSVRTEYQYLITNLQYVESELSSLEGHIQRVRTLTNKMDVINEFYNTVTLNAVSTSTELSSTDYIAESSEEKTDYVIRTLKPERLVKSSTGLLPSPLITRSIFDEGRDLSAENMSERIEIAVQDSEVLEHKVLELWEGLSERQNFLRATPSIRPVNRGWFSSRFGIRADPFTGRANMHSGLDIAGPYGTPIMTVADGIISFAGWQGGYGKLVTVDHGYGVKTRYAHMSKIFVKPGQKVKRFDRLGAMGSTGRSTSTHLHYEVRIRGVAVDPINYILDF